MIFILTGHFALSPPNTRTATSASSATDHACMICVCPLSTPQSTEGPYLDHGETTNGPIEKVYVTTLVTPMGLSKYVDGGNSKITPKK